MVLGQINQLLFIQDANGLLEM
uniref:Uncharacterized protein n=1 Tax=Arundo donax TaxID=35708 RepID=A0A0A9FJ58_ARUDO